MLAHWEELWDSKIFNLLKFPVWKPIFQSGTANKPVKNAGFRHNLLVIEPNSTKLCKHTKFHSTISKKLFKNFYDVIILIKWRHQIPKISEWRCGRLKLAALTKIDPKNSDIWSKIIYEVIISVKWRHKTPKISEWRRTRQKLATLTKVNPC